MDGARRDDLEREAVQDVARLMLSWAGRLGDGSDLGRDLEAKAAEALLRLEDQDSS